MTAAFFNLWMWLWLVSYALSTIRDTRLAQRAVEEAERKQGFRLLMPLSEPSGTLSTLELPSASEPPDVVHLIVLPNCKEDESILASTLEALLQCVGARNFRVVLA